MNNIIEINDEHQLNEVLKADEKIVIILFYSLNPQSRTMLQRFEDLAAKNGSGITFCIVNAEKYRDVNFQFISYKRGDFPAFDFFIGTTYYETCHGTDYGKLMSSVKKIQDQYMISIQQKNIMYQNRTINTQQQQQQLLPNMQMNITNLNIGQLQHLISTCVDAAIKQHMSKPIIEQPPLINLAPLPPPLVPAPAAPAATTQVKILSSTDDMEIYELADGRKIKVPKKTAPVQDNI